MANKHMKRCLSSLMIRENEIKATMMYFHTAVKTAQKHTHVSTKWWDDAG